MRKFAFSLCLCIVAVFLAATMSTALQVACDCTRSCSCECDCANACCEEGLVCPICEAVVKRRELPRQPAAVVSIADFDCADLGFALSAAEEPCFVFATPVESNIRMNN